MDDRLPSAWLVVAVLGGSEPDTETLRRAAGVAVYEMRRRGLRDAAVVLPDRVLLGGLPVSITTQAIAEGALSANDRFDRYRTQPTDAFAPLASLVLFSVPETLDAAEAGARRGQAVAAGVATARDLCRMPPNDLGPADFANVVRALAADARVTVTVMDHHALRRLGMGALLGVGQGSSRPPVFVEARYAPKMALNAGAPVVLIGKTVTFDSGGISLKPALEMDRMKADMGGGAAVLGALQAAAALDLPIEVVALFPTVENMPGGGAIRPGDVVRTLSGRTVEVLNTDAEGRLILADALHYADRLAPSLVIDIATLTGASAIVFGPVGIGFFSTDDALAAALCGADRTAGERLWRLPLWPEHRALLESQIADLANIASTLQQGSMMTAAGFLHVFAGAWPWAHLDIYNTAWTNAPHPTQPKGPTASGTRTLVQFLIEHAETLAARA